MRAWLVGCVSWLLGAGMAWAQAQPAAPAHCATAASAAATPAAAPTPPDGRDRGLMWRLERSGRTSYLYGTVHVGRPAWARLGPRVAEALLASDLLALELDVSDPGVLGQFVRALPPLPEPSAALNQRLLDAVRRECGDVASTARLPPLLRMLSLALLSARREGLDPTLGLEQLLARAAREAKRPIVSLEDAAAQAQALSPERPSDFEQQLSDLLRQIDDGSAGPLLLRLLQAWERGDVRDLADYPRWCDCLNSERERAWFSRINDVRNVTLAHRIEALHSGGQRVFAAIGVLHMTGPDALPLLLARKGFVVQQVNLQ